ncbi:MAG: hypothetical protein BWY31_04033 [Lentisphaerae bacterium ADurb.Bin242]|nr:MAG: hypothetical protein BWY31_04033 [Lentisphaerae bacterium ADurb.Bin242]
MKKFLTGLAVLFALSSGMGAAEDAKAPPPDTKKASPEVRKEAPAPVQKPQGWTPFQLVFYPGMPSWAENSTVYGLKLGVPMTGGNGSVTGVEASFLYSGTRDVTGIQASWFGVANSHGLGPDGKGATIYGVQAGPTMAFTHSFYGLQAGSVSYVTQHSCGAQAGFANVSRKRLDGFQTGLANVSANEFNGFQFGPVNYVYKIFNGFQLGAVNIFSGEAFCGFQTGIVNVCTGKKGIQLGAVNVIADSWLPFMIIFNISL